MEPVELYHERDHVFVSPIPKPRKGKGRCRQCGKGFANLVHLGPPESLNVSGSGNRWGFQNGKKMWQGWAVKGIQLTELPLGLKSVFAEGQVCFPDLRERDEGNFRYMMEKAIGDALQEGRWLSKDCFFPEMRYSFGNLRPVYQKGQSWMRIILFPTPYDQAKVVKQVENPWVAKVRRMRG